MPVRQQQHGVARYIGHEWWSIRECPPKCVVASVLSFCGAHSLFVFSPFFFRKMLLWHCFFSYFCLTLRRVMCCPAWQWKRNFHCFWLTWFTFVFLQGCFLSFAFWKCKAIWEGKADLISHCTHYPACSEGERTEKNNKIHIRPPSRSFSGRQSTMAVVFRTLLCTLNCVS